MKEVKKKTFDLPIIKKIDCRQSQDILTDSFNKGNLNGWGNEGEVDDEL